MTTGSDTSCSARSAFHVAISMVLPPASSKQYVRAVANLPSLVADDELTLLEATNHLLHHIYSQH